MALKTNYKDDVPDESVNVNRKFNMIDNGDGTVSFEDATEYEQVGDNFGALDVNAITKALTDETANVSFQFGIDGNGDYGYIKEGETAVTPFKTRHTETYKPTSRAANLDMGLYHQKRYVDTTSVPNTNSGTYKPTQRKNNNDMGATNTYRYVDTTSVPNTNSQTYSVTSNGTKDMGETNIYRYVSVNVNQTPSFYQKSPTTQVTYTADNDYSSVTAFADIGAPEVTISKSGNIISVVINEAITMRGAMGGNKNYTRTIGVNMTI